MEVYLWLLLFLSLWGGSVLASGPECSLPPSLWCSSPNNARLCQVEKQCASFWQRQSDDPLVGVAVYYESLCPDSIAFIKNQLHPTWTKVQAIMNLTLVPYGNAKESYNGTHWEFECQHGPNECLGNVIETCVLHKFKIGTAFEIVHCMSISEEPQKAGKKCTEQFSMDYTPVEVCASGMEGNKLEHQMAVQTDALDPPHNWVPWITLYGEHTDEIQKKAESDLLSLVCDSYRGSTTPSACHGSGQAGRHSYRGNV